MSGSPPSICILGGGFSGLYTALYLQRFPNLRSSDSCRIALVEPKDRFLFTPLLYELVTGELKRWEIAPTYKKLLHRKNVRFYQDTVQGVDLELRQVKMQSGELLTYDYLVLAVGGETRFDSIPGAATYALPFRSLTDAENLKEQLRCLETSNRKFIRIAIAGGGPNGVELACKLADRLKQRGQVYLLERGKQILKPFSISSQIAAYQALKARNVQVALETSIDAIAADQIRLVSQGQVRTLDMDLVLWTAGIQSIEWVQNLPCQHNDRGQLLTLPNLRLVDYPEVFALGDLAAIQDAQGRQVPATAQAAYQQASCAAHNLQAILIGRPLLSFRYLHLGEMLTLGTNAAVVSSFGLSLKGTLARAIRQWAYLYRMPTLQHRLQVVRYWFANWLFKVLTSHWQ